MRRCQEDLQAEQDCQNAKTEAKCGLPDRFVMNSVLHALFPVCVFLAGSVAARRNRGSLDIRT
jgi:hypothetical protein